ncbi:MAG TPA: hypothetical protein ENN22_04670 [bacterium]|nr:hypothetical protein [bacterium]
MSGIEIDRVCNQLSHISHSDWVAIKFEKQIPVKNSMTVRFCEAVYNAQKQDISLSPLDICCDGAKRCFGWLKNYDIKLAHRLAEKIGITQKSALELIKSVPVQKEMYSGLSLSRHANGDVYISYANPESAMKLIRYWQKATGCNLETEISSIMSVCGNIAVKSYIDQKISISFGCPDSREYGGIKEGQLVMGIPHSIACQLCRVESKINI